MKIRARQETVEGTKERLLRQIAEREELCRLRQMELDQETIRALEAGLDMNGSLDVKRVAIRELEGEVAKDRRFLLTVERRIAQLANEAPYEVYRESPAKLDRIAERHAATWTAIESALFLEEEARVKAGLRKLLRELARYQREWDDLFLEYDQARGVYAGGGLFAAREIAPEALVLPPETKAEIQGLVGSTLRRLKSPEECGVFVVKAREDGKLGPTVGPPDFGDGVPRMLPVALASLRRGTSDGAAVRLRVYVFDPAFPPVPGPEKRPEPSGCPARGSREQFEWLVNVSPASGRLRGDSVPEPLAPAFAETGSWLT